MTGLWFIFWLLNDTPQLHQWNNWATALVVCIVLDVFDSGLFANHKKKD